FRRKPTASGADLPGCLARAGHGRLSHSRGFPMVKYRLFDAFPRTHTGTAGHDDRQLHVHALRLDRDLFRHPLRAVRTLSPYRGDIFPNRQTLRLRALLCPSGRLRRQRCDRKRGWFDPDSEFLKGWREVAGAAESHEVSHPRRPLPFSVTIMTLMALIRTRRWSALTLWNLI